MCHGQIVRMDSLPDRGLCSRCPEWGNLTRIRLRLKGEVTIIKVCDECALKVRKEWCGQ